MSLYEEDNSNHPKKEGSGCFPYCLMAIGAALYAVGYKNKLSSIGCLSGEIMVSLGGLGIILENSKGIKKGLEGMGKSVMANGYQLKRRIFRKRDLDIESLDFNYMFE